MFLRFPRFITLPILTCALLCAILLLTGAAVADETCCSDGSNANLPIINFDNNSADLNSTETTKLKRLAQVLEDHPNLRLVVYGHTDSTGNISYNQRLSERRARVVAEFLIARGIAGDRLKRRGFSESRPMSQNGDNAGRADNRRVVFAEQ